MSPWRSRTPQEREAARVERERRRAASRGETIPDQAAAEVPAAESPQRPEGHEPARTAASAPVMPGPVSPPSFAPLPSAAPSGTAVRTESEPSDDGEVDEPEPPMLDGEEPEPEPTMLEGDDEPAGTRRISGLQRARGRHRGRRTRSGSATPRRARRVSRGGRLLAVTAIVLAGAVIWFLIALFQPFHGAAGARVRVVIPAHLSSGQIGDLLEHDGVISSSFLFELRASLAGERGQLRSGTYDLQRGMSYGAALKVLITPPKAAKVTSLTVIEGQNRRALSRLLRSQRIRGDYFAETKRSRLLDPRHYGAPRSTPSLEGFLFPDTYQLREPITTSALIADQLRTFKARVTTARLRSAAAHRLTPYQVLIIASIIQGEARTARDRALISSVIYNRLHAGMLLQMDDTVRYAVGNFTTPITLSQLHSHSPWNTYTHKGLPPTPINSPDLDAIRAAARPAHTRYLFFVVKPCGNGSQVFASTYAQFLVLQNRYYSARSKRGGRSPEFCR